MGTVALYDIDSRIPNLALMKLSSYYKAQGYRVVLERRMIHVRADLHLASAVFHCEQSRRKVDQLRAIYGNDIEIGGTGIDVSKRLPPAVEACFPDYGLYRHKSYALGFLTRGCHKRCPFCLVSDKEGAIKIQTGGFDEFVPEGQKNVMLLDDNLLAYPGVEGLLDEMVRRRYAVNFNQTLDIGYLKPEKYALLRRIDYRNARFTRSRIYFSCNSAATVRRFHGRKEMLSGFGRDAVCVVCIYGFDTSLVQDYERWFMLRHLMLVPFFQEYWPLPGVPPRVPRDFFDMDLDRVIRLTFRSNGQNWEKYLRWLNRRYFRTFGRYYLPLVRIIYRYNNKARIRRFLARPELLTSRLYHPYGDDG